MNPEQFQGNFSAERFDFRAYGLSSLYTSTDLASPPRMTWPRFISQGVQEPFREGDLRRRSTTDRVGCTFTERQIDLD